jgi:plastocyanin
MRRIVLLSAVMGLLATTCGGSSSSGAARRTVLVDYNHDEFAAVYIAFFPTSVTVRPGDTVHFKQAWNGEPHSVTLGTLVDQGLGLVNPLLEKYPGGEGAPPEADSQFEAAFKDLPFMLGDNDSVIQSAAQPCYLDTGKPSSEPDKPCPKRPQPAFNGRQTYYSSGFIPYAGNQGNTFDVKLADDIKPGTYGFYCNFHGPSMQGKVIVKPKGSAIPSEGAQDKAASDAAEKASAPLLKAIRTATAGKWDIVKAAKAAHFPIPADDVIAKVKDAYFAGYGSQEAQDSFVNEFLPRTIRAKVGEKVTWAMAGFHTISFDVPRYFPILRIEKSGKVVFDERPAKPAGGPGFPEKTPEPLPNPFIVDGGNWNGHGFRNSGFPPEPEGDDEIIGFSLTFTKAGTYPYACLIHPRMVGKVIVS